MKNEYKEKSLKLLILDSINIFIYLLCNLVCYKDRNSKCGTSVLTECSLVSIKENPFHNKKKIINVTGPKTEPWSIPLHVSLHVNVVPLKTTH